MFQTLLILTGCITVESPENPLAIDDDGDGYTEFEGDCDDLNPQTFPGAAEHESEVECLSDNDEDGWSAENTDCDDTDPSTVSDMDCDGVLSVDDCDDTDPHFQTALTGMDFFDTSAELSLSNSGFAIGQSDFTFEYWVHLDQVGSNGDLFQSTTQFTEWLRISIDNDEAATVTHGIQIGQSSNYCVFYPSVTFNRDNAWHHVAMVRSGLDLSIYYDGVLESTTGLSWYGCNCGATQTPCLGDSADARIGGNGLSGIILGPARFSSTNRYTSSSFTPAINWMVDASTLFQFDLSGGFDGITLEDASSGNSAIVVSGVSPVDICPF